MTGPRLDGAQWAAVLRGETTPEDAAGTETQHWTPEQRRSALGADNRRLREELRRTEGDLAVAVREATTARSALAERDREAEASAARWRAMAAAAGAAGPEETQQ